MGKSPKIGLVIEYRPVSAARIAVQRERLATILVEIGERLRKEQSPTPTKE